MTGALALIQEATAEGLAVSLAGSDQLKLVGPKPTVAKFAPRFLEHKQEVLMLLQAPSAPAEKAPQTSKVLKVLKPERLNTLDKLEHLRSGEVQHALEADGVANDLERHGLPRSWVDPLARILEATTLCDYSPFCWKATADAAFSFARQWGERAFRLGWRYHEVFGIHPTAPAARIDCRGLAFMLADDRRVIDIDAEGADLETVRGVRQRFYRRHA